MIFLSTITLSGFGKALKENNLIIKDYFNKYLKNENGFVALNTAYSYDGVFIFIPDNVVIENPIQIINLTGSDNEQVLSQPRNLIIAGKNSSASIIDTYFSTSKNETFTNNITEIFAGEGSNVKFIKIQNENDKSYHISRTQAEQKRNSVYTTYTITTGGSLVRNDNNVLLNDEGCETHFF